MIGDRAECIKWLCDQQDDQYEIKAYKKKRTLSANNYYWKMVGEMARHLQISNSRIHNMMLRRYGTLQELNGENIIAMIPDTDKAEAEALEAETYHLKPTSMVRTGRDCNYRAYMLVKGSHEYNSQEMARLIDGVAEEMKDMGLTPPPTQELAETIRRMAAAESRRHRKDEEVDPDE